MELHEKLQELRKQKGLTQQQLAQALYVSRTAVSKWESGRGYPSIDSLKALAAFYRVTVDQLLRGEELLTLADQDRREKDARMLALVWGLLDISVLLFLVLPFFAQRTDAQVLAVCLLRLTNIAPYCKVLYWIFTSANAANGILTLALPGHNFRYLSLILSAAALSFFVVSLQPYPAIFLFLLLLIKATTLLKRQ